MEKLKVVSMVKKDRHGIAERYKARLGHGDYFLSKESFLCCCDNVKVVKMKESLWCCFRRSNIWRIVCGDPQLQCPLEQSKEILKRADDVLFRKNSRILNDFVS